MEHLLTKLKSIEPSQDFKTRSKTVILSSPQNQHSKNPFGNFLEQFQYRTILNTGLAAVILVLGGLSLVSQNASPALTNNLDPEQLGAEAEGIQIQLSQAQYYEESAQKIEIALNQTSDGKN